MTISFYQYANIGNPQVLRDHLFLTWNEMDVLGRIYVATEGINAQLSVPAPNFDKFKKHLDTISFLEDVRLNIAREQDNMSFLKLKVKVRKKIVADGLDDNTFDVTTKGVHVDAKTFNDLIEDPDTVLVDMRNHYESDMYCTGGIRCEKASAYYKHKGFKQVFQLEGGIIEYARQVESEGLENKFKGKNFVFDHRRGERISDDVISNCHQCGKPCDVHENCANEACHLLFIQCEECKARMDNCCSDECKEIAALPFEEQKALRKGKGNSNKIFKKGRSEVLKFKK